jgi:hypothetical protein
MRAFRVIRAVRAFTIIVLFLCAAQDQQPAAASSTQQQQSRAFGASTDRAPAVTVQPATTRKVTAYTLPPDLYQKAHNLNRIYFRMALIGPVCGLIVLWLILHWKLGPKYRDWAERSSARRFLQALVFSPPLL